ncbi:MAG: phospholipid carrier-dependent glycosyltransferase [Chloroflexi bacterium]|nr:phospholipid carrier-dependent glycosyltransferase [Chloroflexota bacterium]
MGSAAIRLHILSGIAFDGLYGQDAYAYFQYGQDVYDSLAVLHAPGQMYWPLGFPIVIAVGFLAGDISAESAQVITIVCSALASSFMFLLVNGLSKQLDWKRLDAAVTGIVAALLLMFSAQFLQSSVVVMSDAPAVMWAILSAWSLVEYVHHLDQSTAYRWLLLTSFALGMAGITRWIYFLLALPWALYVLPDWGWRIRWRDGLIAVFPAGFILLLQLLHSSSTPDAFYTHDWLQDWNIAHAAQRDFVNADGTFHYGNPVSLFYLHTIRDNYYVSEYLLPLFLLGASMLLWRFRHVQGIILLLGGWFAVTYGFLIGIPYENIRFALAFHPVIIIMIALGFGVMWHFLWIRPRLGWLMRIAFLAALFFPLQITYNAGLQRVDEIATAKNKDLAAIEWAKSRILEEHVTVYTLDLWLMMEAYAPQHDIKQIYYETPESLSRTIDPLQPTYLLLNMWAINNQWLGKEPWIAVQWLHEHHHIVRIGQHGNYTLYRINSPTPVG